MQINKRKNKKLLITIISIVVVLIGAAGVAAYYKVGPFTTDTGSSTNSPATDEQKKAGDLAKQNSIDNTDQNKGVASGSDPAPSPTPNPNGGKQTVNAEITAANQNGSTFQVRTLIQTVANSGTCTLTMTGSNGRTYSATADVQALPSSSTCKGFDVPVSSLGSGSWALKIEFSNDTITASATKQVMIN